jgi:hypothetical protein
MIFRDLQPRKMRGRIASKRRQSRFMKGVFDRFNVFKVRLAYGRGRKVRHWWGKPSRLSEYKWRTRNGN